MIAPREPHTLGVNPIVAADSDALRRALVDLVRLAAFDVRAVAEDLDSLAGLLRPDPEAWMVTGGSLTRARPFLGAARAAEMPAVAVLSGRPDAQARSELQYGGVAVLRGAPSTAALRAAALASRAGLNVWQPDPGGLDPAAESDRAPLSPRERSVLAWAGAGLSTKAIARRLGISPNTVKFHLQAAFDKLGAASRAEAVMAAIRRGELVV